MYLVLMALLALNVSKEVLDGFLTINESLDRNNENFHRKIEQSYYLFEQDYESNPAEVGPFWDKAKEAKRLSSDLRKYIKDIQFELISITEGIPIDSVPNLKLGELQYKDNYDIPTRYFVGSSSDGSGGKAGELRKRIDEYKLSMLKLVDVKYLHKIQENLVTDGIYVNADDDIQNWEMHHFYYNILVADLAILNNLIAEVQHTEFDVISSLYESISAEDYHYDNINARVISKSNYIFTGENYEAEIIVSAYDSSQTPEAYYRPGIDELKAEDISKAIQLVGSGGKISLVIPATTEGVQKYAGLIRVKNKLGEVMEYPFYDEYVVARPSITISAKHMNVLYIGVDNPLSISVPGIPRENLILSISCGALRPDRDSDDWIAEVPSGYRVATVKVSAKVDQKIKEMGVQNFRVKKIPDPIATIANRNQGFVDKNLLKVAGGLEARMPDDFEYNLQFKIKSFIMTTQRGFTLIHATGKGSLLTEEMKANIEMTNRGQNIIFEDILAEDPSGAERKLAPIILSVN